MAKPKPAEEPAPKRERYHDHVADAIERRTRQQRDRMLRHAVPFTPAVGKRVHRRGWCSL